MTTAEFLRELRRLDVDLWLDGDRIRCSAPSDVLTAERRAELAQRRPEIETLLKAAAAARPGSVVPIQPSGSRLPFYAVPGHNGDVFCFVRLAHALGAGVPFYGLQPPGLDGGAAPLERIEDLAAHFVRDLLRHQPDGPYQLGGYCLGGFTAFEMARQLLAMGREVRTVVLFGTMSPAAVLPSHRARAAVGQWTADRRRGVREFAALSTRDRIARIQERVRAPFASDDAADQEGALAERRRRLESTTVAAAYRYRPEPYDGRLTVFVANAAAIRSWDCPLEWARYARAGLDVFEGPSSCDGDSMLKDDAAAVFAAALAPRLALSPESTLMRVQA